MDCMIAGAAIFAFGSFFGAMLYAAGQQSQKNKASLRFQDAFLKGMERVDRETPHN